MRPFTTTISLDEARRRLNDAVAPIARTERVALIDAAGRVTAVDLRSEVDVPPFARSAMDGYAVVAADTTSASRATPVRLHVVDRIYTGQLPQKSIASGTCAEIATGAALPAGADAVIMVEETAITGPDVQIFAAVTPGQHIGRRGSDIALESVVVRRGDVLNPGRVGALAAIGRTSIEVYERPKVAILSTGNEVVEAGHPLGPGQIFDVNRFTLAAIVTAHGGVAQAHAPAHDSVEALLASLDICLAGADVVVFSGGSSVGERDLIRDAIAARGDMIFHGIAVKPGKPTAFAKLGGKPFFGMPGNPTSCLSNAYVLLVPFLRATARLPVLAPRVVRVPLGRRIVSTAGRHQFYTVRVAGGAAFPAFKGSGDITSLSQADGYIEIVVGESVIEQGTVVDVTLF